MKRLFFAIVAVALLWSGYWVFQAYSLRNSLEHWFEARQEDGWEASYSDLAVRGFPNRLDVTFTDLVLANPDNQTVWEAPFFQMFSLVYTPGHWIFAWPDTQTLGTKDGTYQITSEGLRASLVTEDDRILRTNLEAAILNISGPTDLAMAGLNFGVAAEEETPNRLRIGLSAQSIASSRGALGLTTADKLDEVTLRTEMTFDKVWTKNALKGDKPQPTRINLPLAEYKAGKLELKATGEWDVDSKGRLDGIGTLRAVNWRDMLDNATSNGDLPEGLAGLLSDSIGLVASLSGNKKTLDLTFSFDKGKISMGILPLGNAPKIRFK